jgi:hydroxyacylglutathione hydrolase
MLFCGDTLFSFGCGRVFEGSFEQMFLSLEKLKKLDRNYNVYCTHEYTLDNLKFLIDYFKDNEHYKRIYKKLSQRSITLPSKLKDELELNPFLNSNFEEFKQLRIAKNRY